MNYFLIIKDSYGIAKGETTAELNNQSELSITEEQYNTIQCPCTFTLTENNKLFSWKQCELPDDLFSTPVVEKTPIELLQEENMWLKERILQLEVAEVNRKSMEIEQQILGGI